jgi:hypothetical protein
MNKVYVCSICAGLSDISLLEREAESKTAIKELFNLDMAEDVFDVGIDEFWNNVNLEVDRIKEDLELEFESRLGVDPHEDTVEEWRDKMFTEVAKQLNKWIHT